MHCIFCFAIYPLNIIAILRQATVIILCYMSCFVRESKKTSQSEKELRELTVISDGRTDGQSNL